MKYDKYIPYSDFFEMKDGSLRKAYDQLELYVNASYPLIYIQHFDFAVIDSMIRRVIVRTYPNVKNQESMVEEYINGVGTIQFISKKKKDSEKTLNELLRRYAYSGDINELKSDKILILKNIQEELENSETQSLLRQLALLSMEEYEGEKSGHRILVIIVAPILNIPPTLERLFGFIKLEAPNENEIIQHIKNILIKLKIYINKNKDSYKQTAMALRGLSMIEIDHVLSLVLTKNMDLEAAETQEVILDEKRQLVQKSGLLKIVEFGLKNEEVGGLELLKEYLENEAKIYQNLLDAGQCGVPIPKGIMIVGMPGCGKSMTAKLAARTFGVPLISLDIGRLMGQYVGQSEENMRHALSMAESVAPCVLWIDELEKAFSGVVSQENGGSEVTTRLFGQFLTWMQEKRDSVYIIATANLIHQLPPELLRRGRFDEIFKVDLPNKKERKAIFDIYLKKRNIKSDNKSINMDTLVDKSKGYCGADIAAAVENACKDIFVEAINKKIELDGRINITQAKLLKAIDNIIPLSESLKCEIKSHKQNMAKYKFRPASKEDDEG